MAKEQIINQELYKRHNSHDLSYQSERNFLNSIRSEATKQIYILSFNKYREYTKGNILVGNPRVIESQIIDFLLSLKQKGLSYRYLRSNLAAITHFYIMNDIVLNRRKIIKFIDSDTRKKSKNQGYTCEQIHKLIDVCDERTKAIILIYVSTGMRLAALPSLKIGDLKRIKSDDFELYQITVYQGYREEYITFCTPECTKVIDSYLQYRKRCGEELKQDAPLIREQYNSTDLLKIKYPREISIRTIVKIIRNKLSQAGVRETSHIGSMRGSRIRKDIPQIDGFRKFFNTSLMNADVNLRFKELLMGHSIKLDDVYYDKNSEKSQAKLLEEFSKAIDYLTINEENRLRIKVEQLTVEKSQMDKLERQINELRRLVSH